MMVQALYNVVDSIFVSMISENALTAVTIAFPMQDLMISIASGTGVGINALLSRALGEKEYEKSDEAANTGVLLALISAAVFLIIGLTCTAPYVNSQTADPEIRQLDYSYVSIVTVISIGIFMQITFERLLQSTGRTLLSMVSQLTGAIINIVFDPILIFGIGPFPKMGVAGAAYATVMGQCIGACLGLFMNLRFNKEIHFSLKKMLHPHLKVVGRIYAVGIPTIIMMAIGSVMTYCMNLILKAFSSTAIAVFGAYFKLQSFFFMPVFGLNNGMIPVLAYNLGAEKKERIDESLKFAMKLAICIMLCGTAVFELFPNQLLSLFSPSKEMLRMGVPALRTIAIHFPVAAMGIVMGSTFQAFSRSIYSLLVSLGRQLIILIPAAWLLAQTGNVNNVWWSFLIAEGVSFVLSLTFYKKVYREEITERFAKADQKNTAAQK
ncbi:MAG: MATE family efflux transporter [Lachnospiraceae bacterium]|uniref:MATE family efflux transporter n=1 Tax=Candidatus Weimeria bifida TaxID=2599074 RepID=A0A6N7IXY1_9FIRM|nr:MATE family efflux transporter [Candidatus Weimeria bifida]RRF95467.1 MAG: MATE family efflux transporter [Lachnospiraceae bacterium]